jgi:hypothetical protein
MSTPIPTISSPEKVAICHKVWKKCYTKNYDFTKLGYTSMTAFYNIKPSDRLYLTKLSDTPDDYETVDYITPAPSDVVAVCTARSKMCFGKDYDFLNIGFQNMRHYYITDKTDKTYLTRFEDTPIDYQTFGYRVELPSNYIAMCTVNDKRCYTRDYNFKQLATPPPQNMRDWYTLNMRTNNAILLTNLSETPGDFYTVDYVLDPPGYVVAVCDESSRKCYTKSYPFSTSTVFNPVGMYRNARDFYTLLNSTDKRFYLKNLMDTPIEPEIYEQVDYNVDLPFPYEGLCIDGGKDNKWCYTKNYDFRKLDLRARNALYYYMYNRRDKKLLPLKSLKDIPDTYRPVDFLADFPYEGICSPVSKKCYAKDYDFSKIDPSFKSMRDFAVAYKESGAFPLNTLKDTPLDYEAVEYVVGIPDNVVGICFKGFKTCYSKNFDFSKYGEGNTNLREFTRRYIDYGPFYLFDDLSNTPLGYFAFDYDPPFPYGAVCSKKFKKCWSRDYKFREDPEFKYENERDLRNLNAFYTKYLGIEDGFPISDLKDTPIDYETVGYTIDVPYEVVCDLAEQKCYSKNYDTKNFGLSRFTGKLKYQTMRDFAIFLSKSPSPSSLFTLSNLMALVDDSKYIKSNDLKDDEVFEAIRKLRQGLISTPIPTPFSTPIPTSFSTPIPTSFSSARKPFLLGNLLGLYRVEDTPDDFDTVDYIFSPYEGICVIDKANPSQNKCYSKNYDFSTLSPTYIKNIDGYVLPNTSPYKTMRSFAIGIKKYESVNKSSFFLKNLSDTPDYFRTVDYVFQPYEAMCDREKKICYGGTFFSNQGADTLRNFFINNNVCFSPYNCSKTNNVFSIKKLSDTPDDYITLGYEVELPYEGVCLGNKCYSKTFDFSQLGKFRNMRDFYVLTKRRGAKYLDKLSDTPDDFRTYGYNLSNQTQFAGVMDILTRKCYSKDYDFTKLGYQNMRDFYADKKSKFGENAVTYLTTLQDNCITVDYSLDEMYEGVCDSDKQCFSKDYDFKKLGYQNMKEFADKNDTFFLKNLKDTPSDYTTIDYILDRSTNTISKRDSPLIPKPKPPKRMKIATIFTPPPYVRPPPLLLPTPLPVSPTTLAPIKEEDIFSVNDPETTFPPKNKDAENIVVLSSPELPKATVDKSKIYMIIGVLVVVTIIVVYIIKKRN